jgi:hypothetical protein
MFDLDGFAWLAWYKDANQCGRKEKPKSYPARPLVSPVTKNPLDRFLLHQQAELLNSNRTIQTVGMQQD